VDARNALSRRNLLCYLLECAALIRLEADDGFPPRQRTSFLLTAQLLPNMTVEGHFEPRLDSAKAEMLV
jgi:hypothetical protein